MTKNVFLYGREKYHFIMKALFIVSENIFACLFSLHNTISLSRHEQVCLIRLRFESLKLTDKKKLRSKFCCFCPGPHIFFKYARHNHLRCPMMVEVSLET